MKKLVILYFIFLISGCAVTYEADPADELTTYSHEICVIERSDVREEFLTAYKKVLIEKGFSVKVVPSHTSKDECHLMSDYVGKWSWDFKAYMATAEINVYKEGKKIAHASYSSPRGGWSMTTKIYESTETKVRGMLDILFPDL